MNKRGIEQTFHGPVQMRMESFVFIFFPLFRCLCFLPLLKFAMFSFCTLLQHSDFTCPLLSKHLIMTSLLLFVFLTTICLLVCFFFFFNNDFACWFVFIICFTVQ